MINGTKIKKELTETCYSFYNNYNLFNFERGYVTMQFLSGLIKNV